MKTASPPFVRLQCLPLIGALMRRSALLSQAFRFGCVGVAGYFVDLAVLTVALHILPDRALGLPALYLGKIISYLVAATFNWALNRLFTFEKGEGSALHQWARFLTVNAAGGLMNFGVYALLVALVPFFRDHLFLPVGFGALAGMGLNFVMSRRFVFSDRTTPQDS